MVQVETFEMQEAAENMDDCAEVRELIAKLDLSGQRGLMEGAKGLNPYRKITQEEQWVYKTLFAQETNVVDYASGPMPLRVMQVLSHAKDLDFFTKFVVWHPQDVKKDPILLGFVQDKKYTWQGEYFLLARWGEALESFDILRKKAAVMARETIRAKASEAKAEAERILATVDSLGDFLALKQAHS